MQHHGPIAGIASHGDWVATAGYDNQVILWDALSKTARARGNHDHLVNHCAFSADGRWLLSASSDHTARIWSVPSMQLQAVLSGHEDDVDMAVFSPDDSLIATCALDRCVRIFDRSGRCLHTLRGHTGNVLALAWTPDGQSLVSSSVDGSIRLWDAIHGVEQRCNDMAVRTDSVEMTPQGDILAGDDLGRLAWIHDGHTRFMAAHQAGIKKVALDAQQGLLVSLSYDRHIAVWRQDAEQGLIEQARSVMPDTIWARAATFLPDGRVAAGTFGGSYAIFDPRTEQWDMHGVVAGPALNATLHTSRGTFTVGDAGTVSCDGAAVSEMGSLCNFLAACGTRIFTGGQLGRVFDALTGQVLHEHHSPLNCAVAYEVAQQAMLAVGSYTGDILLFALTDEGLHLQQTLKVHDNAIKGLSHSQGTLFSVCANTDVAWHRCADGQLLHFKSRAHERIANGCCTLGPDRFATISRDRQLRLFHGDEVESFDSPHRHSVKCLAINADRTLLLTGSYGGTLAMFDLRTKQWRQTLRPTACGISSLTWNEADHLFIAASYDGHTYSVHA